MSTRRDAGFTLIELMIVVVIIGILASIAVPKFRRLTTDARAAEVEPLLRQVYTLQERYRAAEGTYTLDIEELEGGATLPESGLYFALVVVAHPSGFCVVANPNAAGTAAGITARSLDATRTFHRNADCS